MRGSKMSVCGRQVFGGVHLLGLGFGLRLLESDLGRSLGE